MENERKGCGSLEKGGGSLAEREWDAEERKWEPCRNLCVIIK